MRNDVWKMESEFGGDSMGLPSFAFGECCFLDLG